MTSPQAPDIHADLQTGTVTRRRSPQRDMQWRANLAAFAEAVEALGYEPPSTHGDPNAVSGRWITVQRRAAATGDLPQWRTTELDAVRPGWRVQNTDDARWRTCLASFIVLTAQLGREPARESNDPSEAKSARWAARQRRYASAGTLEPSRFAALDAAGLATNDAPWQAMLHAYVSLVDLLGREPSRRSKNATEKRAAQWISTQRGRVADTARSARRIAALDATLPGWRKPTIHDTTWQSNLAALVECVNRLGRNPSSSDDADPRDRRARVWLASQRHLAGIGGLPAQRTRELDAAIPGWSDLVMSDARWREQLAAYVALCRTNGMDPNGGSQLVEVVATARWLSLQREQSKRGTQPPWRAAALDAERPGWRTPDRADAQWRITLQACAAASSRLGHLPTRTSGAQGDRACGRWLARQREAANAGTLAPGRRSVLDAGLPGWLPTQ